MPTYDKRLINFTREEDSIFYHGTLSDLDGYPQATWDFAQDGGKFTHTVDLEEDEFDAIWNSLNHPVFKRCIISDPNTELNIQDYYVVGAVAEQNGKTDQVMYRIDAFETDPAWQQWIRRVEKTQKAR